MLKKILLFIAGVFVILLISAYVYLYSFLPDYDGTLTAPGLKEVVTVERNQFAVPTITAQNDDDLYFAWGYVNAQDRMFQMEFTRRIAQARVSEIAGESTIKTDLFLKAVGFYDIAKRTARDLSPEMKRVMQRYVDGVNYYLDSKGTPLYMKLMGLEKETWTIADATSVAMMLNWSLAYNMKHEILYHKIGKKIGEGKARDLIKYNPGVTPTIMEDSVGPYLSENPFSAFGNDFEWLQGSLSASNNWAAGPQKTAHKGSLFSSDMQVHNSKLPNDFYLIHVKSGSYDAAGAQVVGLPFIISGYNQKFAWGLTNNGADMVDLFAEKIDWDKKTYRYQGADYPLGQKEIEIKIKGKDPVKKTIYYVDHKPVITEIYPDLGIEISLDWTGFDEINTEGFYFMNKALTQEAFIAGASMIRMSPQNMVYADADGNIGYRVVGSLPLRKAGTGNIIQDGEKIKRNWEGNVPNEDYPHIRNPERGYLATANNKVTKESKYYYNGTYAPGYRYENIVRMLRDNNNLDVDFFKKMQTDTHTVLAAKVQSLMQRYVTTNSKLEKDALDTVLKWDGYNHKESIAPSIYNTFYVRLFHKMLADDIGDELADEYVVSRYISQENLFRLIETGSELIDDQATPEKEALDIIASAAFKETVEILSSFFDSNDIQTWHWGEIHKIKFDHVLGKSALLRPLVNYGPFPFEGDSETNNRARFYEAKPPFIANLASAPRIVVKFDPKPQGHMMLITGENEYFLSPHNTDMTDAWLRHEFFSVENGEVVYKMSFKPK